MGLAHLEKEGKLVRPVVPEGCTHNAHIYYIRIPNLEDFKRVCEVCSSRKISVFTHYVPLHQSKGGNKYARTHGDLTETISCFQQLVRLPIWVGLTEENIQSVVQGIADGFVKA